MSGDACSSPLSPHPSGLHIAAIFILLVASGLGVALPCFSIKNPTYVAIQNYSRAFGVGVVLAVALVHMLPDSNDLLGDPCLGNWPNTIPNLASTIVVAALLVSQGLELFGVRLIELSGMTTVRPSSQPTDEESNKAKALASSDDASEHDDEEHDHEGPCLHADGRVRLYSKDVIRSRRDMLIVFMLEISIAIHSVLIGVDMAFQPYGQALRQLVIALCFHQFFEGMALGTAMDRAKTSTTFRIISCLVFSLTLPLGLAIGLGVRSHASATNSASLIGRGCLNAAAAGFLLYSALVEMLNNWFTKNRKFYMGKSQDLYVTMGFLYLGAAGMTVIGKWA